MSFGTNLQFLRKKKEMTQEELAERLDVSRQTVSKWESDGAYPETEKIIALCDMFSCTMDELLRGNMPAEHSESDKEYDRHMNYFAAAIAGGVGLILLGVTVLLVLLGLSVSIYLAPMIFLCFVTAAVVTFVAAGISHSNFMQEHPLVGKVYDDETRRRFNRLRPILIAASVGLILIGVILRVGMAAIPMPESYEPDYWEGLMTAPMFLCLTIAVSLLVWTGIQTSKYNVDVYNKTAETTVKRRHEEDDTIAGTISGCIMMSATVAYLLMGFLGDLWHPGWVVFPIGGILCGIVSLIFGDKRRSK